MTATKQFIEDAKEGGHDPLNKFKSKELVACLDQFLNIHKILLNKDAWQAVGKTRGWISTKDTMGEYKEPFDLKWHRFIDYLASGKSIEEALQAISL